MIAAIYIHPNSLPHLFGENHEAVTLNLGGKYFYKLGEIRGETRILERKKNELYIDEFWAKNVSLLSAIVGANGTGKSTILQLVKIGGQLVIENGDDSEVIWAKEAGKLFYYTPYLTENKSEEDVSNVTNLSKLSQMKFDSKHENMDFSGHWEYHKSERLKRIVLFIEDEKYKNSFLNLGITTFDSIKIQFSKIEEDNWNVSREFVPFFTSLKKIKEEEWTRNEEEIISELGLKNVDEITSSEEYDKRSKKSRLKLTILESIIGKVHSILEHTGNKFLEEGHIQYDKESSESEFTDIKNTKDAFYWFIERAYFEIRKKKYYLPIDDIKMFTDKILELVDSDNAIKNWTILTIGFSEFKPIIDAYQKFLLSFKDVFTYDEKIFITFSPDKVLSTGEDSFYELFSSLNYAAYRIKNKLDIASYQEEVIFDDYILLLDEADLGFHPYWKRKYITYLIEIIPKIFPKKQIQLIIATHDPLTLSDIPNNNIIYLKKEKKVVYELGINNPDRPTKSFGANITNLLADSFFIDDGLIGDFAKEKIQATIYWINEEKKKKDEDKMSYVLDEGLYSYHKKIISIVDEHIVKIKLAEMLDELKGEKKLQVELIDREIGYLIKKRENL